MFLKEFFFSFSLLAFTGMLMIVGLVLLIDALRRFAADAYRYMRPKVNAPPAIVSTLAAAKKSEEKLPPLEEVA